MIDVPSLVFGVVIGLLVGLVLANAWRQVGKAFKPQEIRQTTSKTPAQVVGGALGSGCLVVVLVAVAVLLLVAGG